MCLTGFSGGGKYLSQILWWVVTYFYVVKSGLVFSLPIMEMCFCCLQAAIVSGSVDLVGPQLREQMALSMSSFDLSKCKLVSSLVVAL